MLPPPEVLICAAGFWRMWPYCRAVTPVRAHSTAVSTGVGPQHRSAVPPAPMTGGVDRSPMLGARTARLKLARSLMSLIGAYSRPRLKVSVVYPEVVALIAE